MSNNILLPVSFVVDVFRLIALLHPDFLDGSANSLCHSIESCIKAKMAAIQRHDSFSRYKSAPPGSSDRERLRSEYLDLAGILPDWISDNEVPF